MSVNRITALWGFTEAVFGGILHLLKIPFAGLFLGSAAVIYISLIARNSKSSSAILRATLIVILVKAFVSPYTPITAYFAVTVQGILGYFLFSIKRFEKPIAPVFGLIAITLSGLQKVIILTLLFGNTLWKSIDEFALFVLRQFNLSQHLPASISMITIGIYLLLHMSAGFYAGIISLRIPGWFKNNRFEPPATISNYETDTDIFKRKNSKKKKRWWNKKSGLAIIVFGITLVIISFLFPQFGKNKAVEIIIMFARSIIITLIWFYLLSPLILKWFKKFIGKKQSGYSSEITAVINLFPSFKNITAFVYEQVKGEPILQRIKKFVLMWFVLMLSENKDIK